LKKGGKGKIKDLAATNQVAANATLGVIPPVKSAAMHP